MNNVKDIVLDLVKKDIKLYLKNDRLNISFPGGVNKTDILDVVKPLKNEICEALMQEDWAYETPLPASPTQKGIWSMQMSYPDAAFYNVYFFAEIQEGVDIGALEVALEYLVERHPVLRCKFEHSSGGLIQKPRKFWRFELEVERILSAQKEALLDCVEVLARKRFSLDSDLMIRGNVLVDDSEGVKRSWILLTVHHVACDFWSFNVLNNELHHLINSRINDETVRLRHVRKKWEKIVLEENSFGETDSGKASKAFWIEYLKDSIPSLRISEAVDNALCNFYGANIERRLEHELSSAIRSFCKDRGITVFVFCMAMFQTLLHREGGQPCRVMSPMSGRDRAGSEHVVGNLVYPVIFSSLNTLGDNVDASLNKVEEDLSNFLNHSWYDMSDLTLSLNEVVEPGRMPLAQASFVWHEKQSCESSLWKEELVHARQLDAVNELMLTIYDDSECFHITWTYNKSLYDKDLIERLDTEFERLLKINSAKKDEDSDLADVTSVSMSSTQKSLLLASYIRPHSGENSFGFCLSLPFNPGINKLEEIIDVLIKQNRMMSLELSGFHDFESESVTFIPSKRKSYSVEKIILGCENDTNSFSRAWVNEPFSLGDSIYFRYALLDVGDKCLLLFSVFHPFFDARSVCIHAKQIAYSLYDVIKDTGETVSLSVLNDFYERQNRNEDEQAAIDYWCSIARDYSSPKLIGRGGEVEGGRKISELTLSAKEYGKIVEFCTVNNLTFPQYMRGLYALTLSLLQEKRARFYFYDYRSTVKGNAELLGCCYRRTPVLVESDGRLDIDWLVTFAKSYQDQRSHGELSIQEQNKIFGSGDGHFSFNAYPIDFEYVMDGSDFEFKFITPQSVSGNDLVVFLGKNTATLEFSYQSNCLPDDNFIRRMLYVSDQLISGDRCSYQSALLPNEKNIINYISKRPCHQCLISRLLRMVNEIPEHVALVDESNTWSYKEFNDEINRRANYLIESKGVQMGDRVLIDLPAGSDVVFWFWACFKIGAIYVPVDFYYPIKRKTLIAESAEAVLVISCIDSKSKISVNINSIEKELRGGAQEEPVRLLDSNRVMYTIFTSGSTGSPKGAEVTVSGFECLVDWYSDVCEINNASRFLLISSVGFDLTQKNIFTPFTYGAQLYIPKSKQYDPAILCEAVSEYQITHVNCAPSAFYPLLEICKTSTSFDSVRCVVLGGESIDYGRISAFTDGKDKKLINSYGPTECTDVVCFHEYRKTDKTSNIIGKPISGSSILILNKHKAPVPIGCVGEIHVVGASVGCGYLNLPLLTNEKFVEVFWRSGMHRAYATGDLGYFNESGQVCFAGRADHQVKLRGNRVELEEVESGLNNLAVVKSSGAWVEESRLLALVELDLNVPQVKLDYSVKIKSELSESLPAHMIPDGILVVDKLPLNAHGKLNRGEFSSLYHDGKGDVEAFERERNPSFSEKENLLLGWWKEVLNTPEDFSVESNFFESGGNSIYASILLSKINKNVDVKISLKDMFDKPTLKSMAELLMDDSSSENASIADDITELEF